MYTGATDFPGLYTFPNPLGKVPPGAALVADNLVSSRDGVGESRRGFAMQGTSIDNGVLSPPIINRIYTYQNKLLLNANNTELWYDSTGLQVWTKFTGTYSYPVRSVLLDLTVRGAEANKNLYLATEGGVYKLSAYNSQPVLAGVPPGLDGTGVLAGAGSGFLGASKNCAYQIVFGYTDANGNLLLGNPSARILVSNATAGADNVNVTFTVPQGLTTSHFYQVYRTVQTTYSATPTSNVPPGAEYQLAAQGTLTSGNLSALSVTYTDVTTDALLGATLYTSPSQQGILQANDRPPSCLDMCLFNGMMFYANILTQMQLNLSVLSVGAPNGIQVGDTFSVSSLAFTGAASQNNASRQFKVDTGGTVAQAIANTALNLINCLNANAASTNVYAFYISGDSSLPGQILLQQITASRGPTGIPFFLNSSRGGAYSPALPVSGTAISSTQNVLPNGLYASKVSQPEAVPVVNLNFIGSGGQSIWRILPLRDRLIVFKSDGIFVVTGSTPSSLSITLLDSSVLLSASDSAVILNNSAYALTNQGVVSVTESGVTLQSRAIEGDIIKGFLGGTKAHGIAYESERLYLLAIPTLSTDSYATQVLCYNWVTNAWTRWTLDINCGMWNPADRRLYIGRPTVNPGFLYRERKNYNVSDFVDDATSVTITGVDSSGLVVSLSGVPLSSWVGNGLYQSISGVDSIAIITAVDTVAKTVTVDLQNATTPGAVIPWAHAAASVQVPIPINYVGVPMTAGFPHFVKDWGRINFWFNGGNFPQIQAGFASDVQGSTQYPVTLVSQPTQGFGFGPFGGAPFGGEANYPRAIQTLVPTDVAKSHWIEPALTLSFPQAQVSFLGATASYEIVADVAG